MASNLDHASNNAPFDKKLFNDMVILLKHTEEQKLQAHRDFFRKHGGDYDRGDILILNENLLPEFSFYNSCSQIKYSSHMPNDKIGFIIKNNRIFFNGFAP